MRRVAAFVLATAAALAGCGTANEILEGRKVDYKSAGSLPSLEIPPDLTTPTRDNRYIVPDTGKGAATLSGYEAERAQTAKLGGTGTTAVLPRVDRMRIERAGMQRWLVVQDSPERLWPLVKDFWRENGFLLNVELPEAGVMETDWAENRAKLPQDFVRNALGKLLDQIYSTSERDRFRTRMERAADGGTEIYVSHRGMIEVYTERGQTPTSPGSTIWQPRASDPELEAEFLRRLMLRLGAQEERAKQMVAVAAPQEARAAIRKGVDGAERLAVFEPFDRAWRRVGLALDRVGFTVEDRDRQKGFYFVRYADPEQEMAKKDQEKEGLLGRLAFWRSADPAVKAIQYRVQVKAVGEGAEVEVLNREGAGDGSVSTRRILALLHDQLK